MDSTLKIKIMLKWINLLLSDSSQASVRRFIGLVSFITMIAIFLLTATNIAKIIYSPSSNSIEEDINSETTIQ